MRIETNDPGSAGGATGAGSIVEVGNFSFEPYTAFPTAATVSARRARHLALRFGVRTETAGLLAGLAFGEGRA